MNIKERSSFLHGVARACNLTIQKSHAFHLMCENQLMLFGGINICNGLLSNEIELKYSIFPLFKTRYGFPLTGDIDSNQYKTNDKELVTKVCTTFYHSKIEPLSTFSDVFKKLDTPDLPMYGGKEIKLIERGFIAIGAGLITEATLLLKQAMEIYEESFAHPVQKQEYYDILTVMNLLKTGQYDLLHRLLLEWQRETVRTLKIPMPK